MQLFCFSFAGGASFFYSNWKEVLKPGIHIEAFEYTGRGKRTREPLYSNFDEMLKDAYKFILSRRLDYKGDYAFFGHSMGAKLAFELAGLLKSEGMKGPEHIFLSGRNPPNVIFNEEDLSELSDEEFLIRINSFGGTPVSFFENKELVDFYLPILRNDFRLSYNNLGETVKIDSDCSVLIGLDDSMMSLDQMTLWKNYITGKCNIHHFSGGHFFLNEHLNGILDLINQTI